MVKTKHLFAAGAALFLGCVVYYFIYQSDTAKIKRQLKALTENVNKVVDETKLASGIKAKNIKELFTDPLELEIPSHDISKTFARQDLPGYVMTGRMQFKTISLTFYDISIEFSEPNHAEVFLTARFAGEFNAGDIIDEVNELVLRGVKREDCWFFGSIRAVDVLVK